MSEKTSRSALRVRCRGGIVAALLLALAVAVLLAAGYLLFVLNWGYSTGERNGMLQKFSRKGWVCKTWEGELHVTTSPGVMPVIWEFTVRDQAVAAQVSAAVGKHVVLHYAEHRGVPSSCFGETPYWVDGVRVIE